MANQTTMYDYANLTEQIKVNTTGKSALEEHSKYSFMIVIATITWLLLSCISAFIYCCNYWELFKPSSRRDATDEQSDQSEQSEMEQQSMLLTQVSEVSST
ncbi:uncharacterized protein [Drosophila virilis]|uniref:Uncharacterized protein n=1 Tax=Drosophila virilis TaxID=7244 RepID=A0A0Q9W3F4_DROVI|nr:uncharacterized protein LOC26530483 [Drosophila virilis]KRF79318.1 uncharacterized protein Dvir_GJ25713 [Drosophila virilis]